MSDTETWKGVLTPTGLTVQQVMAEVEFPSYYDKADEDDVLDYFECLFYEEKVVLNGKVYDIEKEAMDGGGIFDATMGDDGQIHFLVSFHNGGCNLNDAIEEATKSIR